MCISLFCSRAQLIPFSVKLVFVFSSRDAVPDTVPVSPGKLGDVAFCIQVKNSYCFSYVTCFNPEVEQDKGRLMPNVKDEPMDNFPPTV